MEAMAQVAAAVTGRTDGRRCSSDAEFLRPIVVPPDGSTTIRVAALVTDDDTVEWSSAARRPASPPTTSGPGCARRPATPSGRAAGPGRPTACRAVPLDPATDLYGDMLFQGGRFQRLRRYHRAAARHVDADVAADAGPTGSPATCPATLLLGDPGMRDALMHGNQVCVPDATLLPTGDRADLPGRRRARRGGRAALLRHRAQPRRRHLRLRHRGARRVRARSSSGGRACACGPSARRTGAGRGSRRCSAPTWSGARRPGRRAGRGRGRARCRAGRSRRGRRRSRAARADRRGRGPGARRAGRGRATGPTAGRRSTADRRSPPRTAPGVTLCVGRRPARWAATSRRCRPAGGRVAAAARRARRAGRAGRGETRRGRRHRGAPGSGRRRSACSKAGLPADAPAHAGPAERDGWAVFASGDLRIATLATTLRGRRRARSCSRS